MCYKPPNIPNMSLPTLTTPPTIPVQQQLPQTQSGADIANSQAKPPNKKSLFQIDLAIPSVGSNGDGSIKKNNSTAGSQVGPKV